MAINPLIPLAGEKMDTASTVLDVAKMKRQEKIDAEESELRGLQTANERIKNASEREKARYESVIGGAAELGTYLEGDDLKGAEQFLLQRRKRLGEQMAQGMDVDTVQTDHALAAIRSGDAEAIKGLKGQVGQLIKLGQYNGMLKTPGSEGFSLSPGQTRYDSAGNVVATAPKPADGTVEVVDPATGQVTYVKPKPLPASALKLQNETLDLISTAYNIDADLGTIITKIDEGKIDLGPIKNIESRVRNKFGQSTETSREFGTLKSTLEKMRNDSLRLNKGVQTEGDAERAWNELFENINDGALVKKRLGEIQAINKRAAELQELNVENIRANFNQPPLDFSKYKKGSALVAEKEGPTIEEQQAAKGATPPIVPSNTGGSRRSRLEELRARKAAGAQ